LNLFNRLLKNTQISNFTKICPVGAAVFQMGRRTDTAKLKVTFTILHTHLKKFSKRLPLAHRAAPHVMNTLFKFCWSNWKHCILDVPCQIAFSARITTVHTILPHKQKIAKGANLENGKTTISCLRYCGPKMV